MRIIRALRNWWDYGSWTPCRHANVVTKRLEGLRTGAAEEYWVLCAACRCVLARVERDGAAVRPSSGWRS